MNREMVLIDEETLEELKLYADLYLTIRDIIPLDELKEMTSSLQSGAEWDAVLGEYLKTLTWP